MSTLVKKSGRPAGAKDKQPRKTARVDTAVIQDLIKQTGCKYWKARYIVLRSDQSKRENHVLRKRLDSIRHRCKPKNIPFDITIEDIKPPSHCPVLGIELVNHEGASQDNTPSVDRIIPEKGYVKGNVIVVSKRVNTIKSNATIEELQKIAAFYSKLACQNGPESP